MSRMSQNIRLFHVSNLSVRNFRIFLLMYTGSWTHGHYLGPWLHEQKKRSLERMNSIRETNGSIDSRKRLSLTVYMSYTSPSLRLFHVQVYVVNFRFYLLTGVLVTIHHLWFPGHRTRRLGTVESQDMRRRHAMKHGESRRAPIGNVAEHSLFHISSTQRWRCSSLTILTRLSRLKQSPGKQ